MSPKAKRVVEIVAGLALCFVCAMILVAVVVEFEHLWTGQSRYQWLLSIESAIGVAAAIAGIVAGILLVLRGYR